jgi:DNA-binding NtrC family response regulator
MTVYKIMLVDNDENVLSALRRVLDRPGGNQGGFAVETHSSPIKAMRRAMAEPFDLFMADFRMPEMDGVAFLVGVRNFQPDAARIIMTGHPDFNVLLGAINEAGIAHFLCKPWDNEKLVETINDVLAQRQLALQDRRIADTVREGGCVASPSTVG